MPATQHPVEPTVTLTGTSKGPVTPEQAREALDSMDDYARMNVGVDAKGPRQVLERLIAEYAQLLSTLA